MRKTFMYRVYLNKIQTQAVELQLREACNLYNASIQERRDAWSKNKVRVNFFTQSNQLKEIRSENLIGIPNYGCGQNVLRKSDLAFQAFFRRVKSGENPGFPRFKPHQRYNSLTYPTYGDGCKLIGSKLRLQGVGMIKVNLHRPIEGKIKTVTIKREAGKWYACFSVEMEDMLLDYSEKAVGIDVGLETFATLSNGEAIANPRYNKEAQAKLRRAQRKVARAKNGSKGRNQAVQDLQKVHAHVRNQRSDHQHKLSHAIVREYGLIAVEKLSIKGLAAGMLAKSVNDVAWGSFIEKLTYKAESAGRLLVKVDPRGTSQRCSQCGTEVRKELKDRWHDCQSCGFSAHRDLNSAYEILRLGLSLASGTWDTGPCVLAEARKGVVTWADM